MTTSQESTSQLIKNLNVFEEKISDDPLLIPTLFDKSEMALDDFLANLLQQEVSCSSVRILNVLDISNEDIAGEMSLFFQLDNNLERAYLKMVVHYNFYHNDDWDIDMVVYSSSEIAHKMETLASHLQHGDNNNPTANSIISHLLLAKPYLTSPLNI